MLSSKRSRSTLVMLALSALPMLTTGCSSVTTQSALSSFRGFAAAAHTSAFAIAATKRSVTIHRHPREHTLSSVRSGEILHHQSSRSL